jgi:hypothetical protein
MTTEAPSLPYARDEGSTSLHYSTYAPYSETYDQDQDLDAELDEEEAAEAGGGMQYWANKRHRGRKGKGKVDDEYSE